MHSTICIESPMTILCAILTFSPSSVVMGGGERVLSNHVCWCCWSLDAHFLGKFFVCWLPNWTCFHFSCLCYNTNTKDIAEQYASFVLTWPQIISYHPPTPKRPTPLISVSVLGPSEKVLPLIWSSNINVGIYLIFCRIKNRHRRNLQKGCTSIFHIPFFLLTPEMHWRRK